MNEQPPPKRAIGRRVAYNTLTQMTGKAAVFAIAAASITILTRYLGPEDYGRFSLALVYVQMFGVLADVGLFTIVVRELSRSPERARELVGNALTIRLLLSVVVVAVAGLIGLALPYEPDVRLAILIAGVPLLFGLLTSSLTAKLQADLRMDRAALAETVGRAASLGGVVIVAALDLGFFAAIGAAGLGALVTLLVTVAVVRGSLSIGFRADLRLWRWLLTASLPVGLALAINELYVRADTLMISLFRPIGDVGLYALSYRVIEIIGVFGGVLLGSVFAVLARFDPGDQRFRSTVQAAWDVFTCAAVPLGLLGAVLAPGLIELIAGSGFDGAAGPLRLLVFAAGLGFVNGVLGYALIAAELQRRALWLNVAGLVVNVGLNLALIPAFGIVAAAAVTVGSEGLVLVGGLVVTRRLLGFVPSPRVLLPALAVGVPVAVAAWVLRDAPVLAVGTGAGLVYVAGLYAISARARELVAMGRG
ncbi:MAG: flippase [Solirubrobacterales bacterium]